MVAALQDNDRAKIIGTRTQGKGSVQSLLPIDEDQGAVRLTTATFFPPSGRNIDRKPGSGSWGIDADDGYVVPVTAGQLQVLQRRMQAHRPATTAVELDALTPANIRTLFGDPQFAAALETLQAKLRRGRFIKVDGRGSKAESRESRVENLWPGSSREPADAKCQETRRR